MHYQKHEATIEVYFLNVYVVWHRLSTNKNL